MIGLLSALLVLLAALLLVPVGVLLVQMILAWPARGAAPLPTVPRPRIAVLMPAHDESAGIAPFIQAVRAQLLPGDRLLVVADNCSDDTADVARAAGAEVVERHDTQRRGKGYALDFGVRSMEASPPDVVVIVDADCQVHPGALDRLARECVGTGRPMQAVYLMRSPPQAGLKTRVAEFASAVKNHARALGLHRLGLPCQLMGTGMAFPWRLIQGAPLASGHIVEDLQLGLDLAAAGTPPRYCPDALVTSLFPSSTEGMASQRTRWEHGHLAVIGRAPGLLLRAIARGQPVLAAMALDLCVPPLALLVLMLVAAFALTAAFYGATGVHTPLRLCGLALALLAVAIALAWTRYGRSIVSWHELLTVPFYVLAKIPLYIRALTQRQTEWVRTKRDGRRE
jgi:cellulose synthase/poly-beta-1,6-N-acetylglucosamine synthase-like glycosyltransferase